MHAVGSVIAWQLKYESTCVGCKVPMDEETCKTEMYEIPVNEMLAGPVDCSDTA